MLDQFKNFAVGAWQSDGLVVTLGEKIKDSAVSITQNAPGWIASVALSAAAIALSIGGLPSDGAVVNSPIVSFGVSDHAGVHDERRSVKAQIAQLDARTEQRLRQFEAGEYPVPSAERAALITAALASRHAVLRESANDLAVALITSMRGQVA